jgi:uncharacterized protein
MNLLRASLAFLALVALGLAPARAEPTFPALTGRVVDAANVLPADVEATLDAELAALEAKSTDQIVVATVPGLQGYEIEEYGYRLGRAWGIGTVKLDNGVILLVAPVERKVRIEVGYGLEGQMTDALSRRIIQSEILPRFRAGDMPGGVVAGARAIGAVLTADPVELAERARAAEVEAQAADEVDPVAVLILIAFILFWIWVAARSARSARFRRSSGWGAGPIIVHDWFDDDRRGGGGFGGFGGGFGGGGGGFSGGGGSFGGGGASGSW